MHRFSSSLQDHSSIHPLRGDSVFGQFILTAGGGPGNSEVKNVSINVHVICSKLGPVGTTGAAGTALSAESSTFPPFSGCGRKINHN